MHVLVMEFIGEDGVAAPRLKDAGLPPPQMRAAYLDMVLLTRKLFQECRLVHADLSEYNILYHKVRGAEGDVYGVCALVVGVQRLVLAVPGWAT